MERLVESLADLPPLLIYATVAFATLVENVLPPMPSDLAVALGGFSPSEAFSHPPGSGLQLGCPTWSEPWASISWPEGSAVTSSQVASGVG